MTNSGLEAAITDAGGQLIRTNVGDKHVIDAMVKGGLNLGGEPSGHIVFGDHATAGDGLVAALQILRIMRDTGQPLSQLSQCWTRHPQILTNIVVKEKKPFADLNGVMDLVRAAESDLKKNSGRLLLRYSGTEPKARLLLEGKDSAMLEQWSEKIASSIAAQIGG
jgi:phosphoglucosamine mutase